MPSSNESKLYFATNILTSYNETALELELPRVVFRTCE